MMMAEKVIENSKSNMAMSEIASEVINIPAAFRGLGVL